MPRTIAYRLYISWDGTTPVAETTRLLQASGENRLTSPDAIAAGRGIVDRCTLELDNRDGRYSPLNSSGALYANIQAGGAYNRPMYLEVSIDGGSNYYRVFTGVIKIPQETTPTPSKPATVTIDCRSRDELLLGRRMSTTLADMRMMNAAGWTEAQVAEYWVQQTGGTPTVDDGVFVISWPWMDDESVLEEIWALASATGGRFYCDPDGTFRYEDMTHWLKSPHTVSQETFTRADFAELQPVYSDAELYNSVAVEASARMVGAHDLLWEPDEPVTVPPGATKTITARYRQPAYSVEAPTWKAATAGGIDITSSVTVTVTASYVQRMELSIANAHATEAAYLHPFNIGGVALTGGPTQEETRTSAANGSNSAWWTSRGTTRSKALRGNAYIQTRAQAGTLAHFLLRRSEAPRLTYRLKGCPGKSSRRCGDLVTINDTAIMSSSRTAFITGISWRLTVNGFTQDIEAMDAANYAPYQSEGYFIIGTNKLGASGSLTARIWY